MATYRNIQLSFWTDSKVSDDFSPEDKYFYLYLLTNPHTSISGCYELSVRQMSVETGYSKDTIEKLLERMEAVHDVVRYSRENKEVLILHWCKYNWTSSPKVKKAIAGALVHIKTKEFKDFLEKCYENMDTVSIGYSYPMDTSFRFVSVSDSLVSDTVPEKEKKSKPIKHKHGEYEHVLLTEGQYNKLVEDYGESAVEKGIKKVDEYCQESGKTYKDYNLTLRKWGITGKKIERPVEKPKERELTDEEWDAMYEPGGCMYVDPGGSEDV